MSLQNPSKTCVTVPVLFLLTTWNPKQSGKKKKLQTASFHTDCWIDFFFNQQTTGMVQYLFQVPGADPDAAFCSRLSRAFLPHVFSWQSKGPRKPDLIFSKAIRTHQSSTLGVESSQIIIFHQPGRRKSI